MNFHTGTSSPQIDLVLRGFHSQPHLCFLSYKMETMTVAFSCYWNNQMKNSHSPVCCLSWAINKLSSFSDSSSLSPALCHQEAKQLSPLIQKKTSFPKDNRQRKHWARSPANRMLSLWFANIFKQLNCFLKEVSHKIHSDLSWNLAICLSTHPHPTSPRKALSRAQKAWTWWFSLSL